MNKPEKFKIIELIKELIIKIDKQITNFPNKEMELKRRLKDSSYELLQLTYEANITYDARKKLELQVKCVAIIKLLDFLVNQCYEKKIINAERYYKFGETFDNIVRYFSGWINSTKIEIGKMPS